MNHQQHPEAPKGPRSKQGQNPHDVLKPKQAQEQKGRPTTNRRQDEIPARHEESRQGPEDRFPRESFEGGRDRQ